METDKLQINNQQNSIFHLVHKILEDIEVDSTCQIDSFMYNFRETENIKRGCQQAFIKKRESKSVCQSDNYNQIKNTNYNSHEKMLKQRANRQNSMISNKNSCKDPKNVKASIAANPEDQVRVLEKKIKKKDDLIKYLERKCGEQIIKSTSKMLKQINYLERQNQQLQKKIQALSKLEKTDLQEQNYINLLQYNLRHILSKNASFDQAELETLSEKQLRDIVILQGSQIQNLLQKLQEKDEKANLYYKSNKQLRRNLMQKMQSVSSDTSFSTLQLRHSSSANILNLSPVKSIQDSTDQNTVQDLTKTNLITNSIIFQKLRANPMKYSQANSQMFLQELDLLKFSKLKNASVKQSLLFTKSSIETQVEIAPPRTLTSDIEIQTEERQSFNIQTQTKDNEISNNETQTQIKQAKEKQTQTTIKQAIDAECQTEQKIEQISSSLQRINSQLVQQLNFAQKSIQITKKQVQKLEETVGSLNETNKCLIQTNQQLKQQAKQLKTQLCYFSEKIDNCFHSIDQIEQLHSPIQQPESPKLKFTEMQQNYIQILQIFNIDWRDQNNHEQLLKQILKLKRQLTKYFKELQLMQKQKKEYYNQKQFFKSRCQEVENMNFQLQNVVNKLLQQLDSSNQVIMQNNFILLATRKQLEIYKNFDNENNNNNQNNNKNDHNLEIEIVGEENGQQMTCPKEQEIVDINTDE